MTYRDEGTYAYILKLIAETDAKVPPEVRRQCETMLKTHRRTESGLHKFLLDITARPREEVGGFVRAFRPNVSRDTHPEKSHRTEDHHDEAHRRSQ